MPGMLHYGMRPPDEIAGRATPLVGALAPHGVSEPGPEATRAQPLIRTSLLTLGAFRRSRSVAYIRADASATDVHADRMLAPEVA
jgi:hypothetical protein